MRDSHKVFLLLCLFAALRVALFDVNAAEWGDSYHILRSARDISRLTYSLEEKRLPLFSAIIAPFLFVFEPVAAGRVVVALAAFAALVLSYCVSRKLFPRRDFHIWVPILLAISPVFFYWSLRVMAITTFMALVLAVFNFFYKERVQEVPRLIQEKPPLTNYLILGILTGLACLTRYEGFFLLPGLFLYFLFKREWLEGAIFAVSWAVVTLPWFVWTKLIAEGATSASYFEEAGGFKLLDWGRFRFSGLSYLFLFIFPPFFVFVFKGLRSLVEENEDLILHLPLFCYLGFETLLFFYWTPSVPRIMLAVAPFLLMFFLEGVEVIIDPADSSTRPDLSGRFSLGRVFPAEVPLGRIFSFLNPVLVIAGLSFAFYIAGQYFERAYFLLLSQGGLALAVIFSGLAFLSLFMKNKRRARKLFFGFLILTFSVSSFVIIDNQREVYLSIKNMTHKAVGLEGKVAYFDETGISWWYLERQSSAGVYLPQENALSRSDQWQWLKEKGACYMLWTNEFNRGSILDLYKSEEYKDKFELINSRTVEIKDDIDGWLIEGGVLPKKDYPKLRSELYEIRYD